MKGDKNIIKFDGDHNSPRPQFYFDSITIFFHNVLNPPSDESGENYFHTTHNFFDKDNWDTVHEAEYRSHNFIEPSPELASSSTEDAITQLRSRRPMSRTEVPPDISSQEKKNGAEGNGSESDLGPSSSSGLYDVHLSNGYQHNRFSRISADDEYVDYSFDTLSDIPCTMEDEERMIMEAIIESLKDLEASHPQEDVQPNASTAPPDTSDVMKASIESNNASTAPPDTSDVMKASIESNGPLETAASSMTASAQCKLAVEPTLDASGSCIDSACIKNSTSSNGTSSSMSSSGSGNSSAQDADGTANTRATLVVEKGPTSNVLNGLTHRWGLNFFRNSR